MVLGLAVSLPTGFLLFMSEAVKCCEHGAFWFKMTSLFLALVFTFTIHRRVVTTENAGFETRWNKVVGLVSLLLWSGVGGRWIGFS